MGIHSQNDEQPEKAPKTIALAQLQSLIDLLWQSDYQVIGPQIQDGAIVYDELSRIDELPVGWTDRQDNGTYRLQRRDDSAYFGFSVGPTSWKRFLHPERLRLWQANRDGSGVTLLEDAQIVPKMAFLGVRSCELHAIAIQDKVFLCGEHQDENYALRRENAVFIAVNCGQAASTCFCESMGTGPQVSTGFDLALTELLEEQRPGSAGHRFVAHAGTELGYQFLSHLTGSDTSADDRSAAQAVSDLARRQIGRTMNTTGIKMLLQLNPDHPRWDDVAARCLSCANCTMVCPTCFCTTVEDTSDLRGDHAERWRRWDSCFSLDFSYLHGGSVRTSAKSRYRQWMTHKLAHWIDQFDSSGCVGCGRCITWCPVGIDITEEVAAIRADDRAPSSGKEIP